ncbi:GNAT family N-acetyltransferase [Streptomyces sp. N2-109]|uniref:GNAT family N-acetyltransferase n=1 Tax=Streptomyces gossypii TaxID=2883101 RepID=A0ABT2JKP5_9ACTN|nr:GNAT family N-acetyltransferase [Streptomyces gossypii]MCT2588450.1 GNAT family N-acetyltransferase [Streptomyces gossypii]
MNWKTERAHGADLDVEEVLGVYRDSGLGERRPVGDRERFTAMLQNANLILACRVEGRLVGIARSISDFSYVTYLSDIAVVRDYQRSGIGRALIEATGQEAPGAKIVLLSAPAATDYYPHIGFTQHGSAWVLSP